MNLKQIEKLLTDHLIESTGIKTKLKNVDDKINWVLGLLSAVFVALAINAMRR